MWITGLSFSGESAFLSHSVLLMHEDMLIHYWLIIFPSDTDLCGAPFL